MKVVKVISSLDFGGIEKVFEIVARYHRAGGDDLVFLCTGKGGAAEANIRALGYRVEVWGLSPKIPNPGLIRRLAVFFSAERPDVVHTTGAEANFHGLIAARIAGVPVRVAEEIGMPDHGRMARLAFRCVYRLASKVIAVAGLVKNFIVQSGEAAADKVEVIFNPVDVRTFQSISKKDDGVFRVVSVCRLDPIKNLELLIRGFGALVQSDPTRSAELWLVGDGPSRVTLENLSRELHLEASVKFWGYQQRPSDFLENASLFVLPSFSEGLPVSAAEAMLTCTPCAVTKIGGGPEFIVDGVNGWLLDPLDQAAFDALLRHIAVLPVGERSEVGSRGQETALEHFRPEQYLKRLDDLYRRCKKGAT